MTLLLLVVQLLGRGSTCKGVSNRGADLPFLQILIRLLLLLVGRARV
jgi:hypothetical protein